MKKNNQPTNKTDSSAESHLRYTIALKAKALHPAAFQTHPYDLILLGPGLQRVCGCTANAEITIRGTLLSYLLLF